MKKRIILISLIVVVLLALLFAGLWIDRNYHGDVLFAIDFLTKPQKDLIQDTFDVTMPQDYTIEKYDLHLSKTLFFGLYMNVEISVPEEQFQKKDFMGPPIIGGPEAYDAEWIEKLIDQGVVDYYKYKYMPVSRIIDGRPSSAGHRLTLIIVYEPVEGHRKIEMSKNLLGWR